MPLKIIFMGTPEFSVPILRSISNSKHELVAVYTQPPKRKNRGQKIIESPIHQFSKKLNIPIKCPNDFNTEDDFNFIKNSNADISIVVAYGKILPKKILDLPNIKFLNIHASLLPKWRGAAPIQRAIMNMDKETGLSIMKIDKELDAGPIMKSVKIKIDKNTTFQTLSQEMSNLSSSIILDCLDVLENKKEKFIPQDHLKATYAKKIDKSEAKINWNDTAKKIIAKINGLSPDPGCWFDYKGARIKVLEAKEVKGIGKPGDIIDNKFSIACLENAIQVLQLKKEGKGIVSAVNFLLGNRLKPGMNLNEL